MKGMRKTFPMRRLLFPRCPDPNWSHVRAPAGAASGLGTCICVCRPGGMIVMGNWTPEGHVGTDVLKVIGKHVPPPPYFPSPLLWGDEFSCRDHLKLCRL